MVEEGWVDTLKKEVIEYTVDRDRHKEMLTVFNDVRKVFYDIKHRVDRNTLRDYADEEIKFMEETLKKVEKLLGGE
tara:strand:- start:765 stop:992 length:228 start_codon:yes stop_codon:yes gene_type:complete